MTPQQVQRHFKVTTQTALARKLRKPLSTVAEWFQRGCVPRAVQWELEIRSRRKLRAVRTNGVR